MEFTMAGTNNLFHDGVGSSQKMATFITTAVKRSNHEYCPADFPP
jgi:hypothetical protein